MRIRLQILKKKDDFLKKRNSVHKAFICQQFALQLIVGATLDKGVLRTIPLYLQFTPSPSLYRCSPFFLRCSDNLQPQHKQWKRSSCTGSNLSWRFYITLYFCHNQKTHRSQQHNCRRIHKRKHRNGSANCKHFSHKP